MPRTAFFLTDDLGGLQIFWVRKLECLGGKLPPPTLLPSKLNLDVVFKFFVCLHKRSKYFTASSVTGSTHTV